MVLRTAERDPLFDAAAEWALEVGAVSVSMLQRRLLVGYVRAARIVDQLIKAGVVAPYDGSGPWVRTINPNTPEARR